MIILDTSVLSEVFRPHPDTRVTVWLESLADDVAITAITLADLLAGVRRLPNGRRRETLSTAVSTTVHTYRSTRVPAFDSSAAEHYATILAAREHAGLPISMADAQIAAICRAHGASCATRDTKDFAQTGIELINPWHE